MSAELVQLASETMPYVTAAAGAYGGAVLTKAKEEAAGATVDLGRRLLQKIFGKHRGDEEVPEVLADVIADPEDPDNVAALRKTIRKALESNESLATDVRTMLTEIHTGDHSNVATGNQVQENIIQVGTLDGGLHINDGSR